MKLLFDFLPIVCFFAAFKLYNFFVATIVAITITSIQVFITFILGKKIQPNHIISLVLIIAFGIPTIIFQDEIYLKWKLSVIYWLFFTTFVASHFIGKKTMIERMISHQIDLPKMVWNKLNISWAIYFLMIGIINLYVVYNYSTDTWVNFKLFGTLGLTLVFVLLQSIYMAKYTDTKNSLNKNYEDNETNTNKQQIL